MAQTCWPETSALTWCGEWLCKKCSRMLRSDGFVPECECTAENDKVCSVCAYWFVECEDIGQCHRRSPTVVP